MGEDLKEARLVSVLMPAYKIKYLGEAIESVLNQTYKNLELIIVNDASPEDLTSVVERFQDDRIRYFVNEVNIGGEDPVNNWNKCLSYAKGEFVSLLCDDDLYEPTFIESMIALSDKYPSVNVFRARIRYVNKHHELLYLEGTSAEYLDSEDFIMHFLCNRLHLTISEWFVRRERMIECGGYYNTPMAWYADDLSMFRFAQKGGMVSNPEILVTFRESGINISSAEGGKIALRRLESVSFFEDEVKRLIQDETAPYRNANLTSLKAFTKSARTLYLERSPVSVILKVIFNRKKYRVSTNSIIRGIWMQPIRLMSRLRAKFNEA